MEIRNMKKKAEINEAGDKGDEGSSRSVASTKKTLVCINWTENLHQHLMAVTQNKKKNKKRRLKNNLNKKNKKSPYMHRKYLNKKLELTDVRFRIK